MKILFTTLLLSICVIGYSQEAIESERLNFTLDTIATDLEIPWSFDFISDNEILIAERGGVLKLYNISEKSAKTIEGMPEIKVKGQGGLLDVRVHPDYDKNGWIYFTYASPKAGKEAGMGQNTALSRAKLKNGKLVQMERIFKALPNYETAHHYGGRIEFDKDGLLYLSVGDRGGRDEVQNWENYRGTVVRLMDDGKIPKDNPFANDDKIPSEIYSKGHRNPQGMAFNEATGNIWVNEHGPMGGDEVNSVKAGKNYGWPTITYGKNYNGTIITEETEANEFTQPIMYWLPSIAPCGMAYVTSDKYPGWKGDLLVGSLKFLKVERLNVVGEKVMHREDLLSGIGRVRTIRQANDGYIYLCAEGSGILVRITPE